MVHYDDRLLLDNSALDDMIDPAQMLNVPYKGTGVKQSNGLQPNER
jgi:hypothetical protein